MTPKHVEGELGAASADDDVVKAAGVVHVDVALMRFLVRPVHAGVIDDAGCHTDQAGARAVYGCIKISECHVEAISDDRRLWNLGDKRFPVAPAIEDRGSAGARGDCVAVKLLDDRLVDGYKSRERQNVV